MNFIKETNRVYMEKDGTLIAEVLFPMKNETTVDFISTFVDESLRGQGIAGELMSTAIEIVKENGWKAVATCPYAVQWFQNHTDIVRELL